MSNACYGEGLDAIGTGLVNLVSDTIRATLVDLNDYALLVSAATNATPIEITTTVAHGLSTGDEVMITGVGGNTAANNTSTNPRWKVTVVDSDSFTLQHPVTGANIAGSGAYTSGGFVVKLSKDNFYDDIPAGARVATGTLASKSLANGIFDAADLIFTAVSGDVSEAVVLDKNTGTESTSPLIAIITSATGLPATPGGGDINIQWDNGYYKIFRL